jgi:4-amino-4-deoxy-L-arabinose transferase-like glycosyltransferase
LGTAATPALLDDADAAHAVVAREMLQRHDYVVMYMNGIRYLMKAPLHYWMVAGTYKLLGQTAFATRLPVGLSMVALTLMVFEFGRFFFGNATGFYSGLVMSTSIGCYIFTRIMIPEAIYAFLFTAIFYVFLRTWTGSIPPRLGYWGCAVLIALAVLARGLIGVVFPVGGILAFVLVTRGWKRWRELRLVSSTAIFLIIALPWHILAELRAPGFLWSYFVNEHFKRALGTRYPPDYDAVPLVLWWALHLVWFFPWCVFLPTVIKCFPRRQFWTKGSGDATAKCATTTHIGAPGADHAELATLLLFIWAGLIMIFFSVEHGSRMEYYSFGAWPAMALLLGLGISTAEKHSARLLVRLQGVMLAIGIVVAAILGYLVWNSLHFSANGNISTVLQDHPTDFYRLSMAHALDLTPEAFADLRVPATLAAIGILGGAIAGWLLRRRKHPLGACVSMALGMVLFFFAANQAYGVFEPHMSSRDMANVLNRSLKPEDELCIYGEFDTSSSVAFYTNRRVCIWNGRFNNLEAGSYYPDAPHIFFKDDEFLARSRSSGRIFLFVPREERKNAMDRLPQDRIQLLAEAGGKAVYVIQPSIKK